MDAEFHDVIIEKDLFSLGTDKVKDYIAHVYCDKGKCKLGFNDREIYINEGDSAIFTITKLIHDVMPDKDFEVTVIYVSNSFIQVSSPDSNYSVKGTMALYRNPVIWLDEKRRRICKEDFAYIEYRLNDKEHHFYKEALSSALRSLFLDFFDFHVRAEGNKTEISSPQADLMTKFLALLENGDFKTHRELSYYADKLCVTPKYLSAVTKKISGLSANYWINRFTVLELRRYLKQSSLSVSQIADEFCFSSLGYFSRYIYNNLGQYPSAYREK